MAAKKSTTKKVAKNSAGRSPVAKKPAPKPRKPSAKRKPAQVPATKAPIPSREKARRIIEEMYRDGYANDLINAAVKDQTGVVYSDGHLRNLIVEVRKKWGSELEAEKDRDHGGHAAIYRARAMDLYRQARAAGDVRGAYAIVKDLAKVCGVDFRDVMILRDERALDTLTEDELDQGLAELDKQLGSGDGQGPG